MSEIERKGSLETPLNASAESIEATESERYEYRWSYDEQVAFDEGELKKKRKRGALTYAITMTAAFLVCFSMLVGVLVWYHVTGRSISWR